MLYVNTHNLGLTGNAQSQDKTAFNKLQNKLTPKNRLQRHYNLY